MENMIVEPIKKYLRAKELEDFIIVELSLFLIDFSIEVFGGRGDADIASGFFFTRDAPWPPF
jgi:hypothetical protein